MKILIKNILFIFLFLFLVRDSFLYSAEIIAHRGASYLAPENTIPSIALAWENDVDSVEIDVQLSKDNEIVLMHDKTTRRTAGVLKRVKSQSLKKLKSLDVGKWKDEKWTGTKIPTLEESLGLLPIGKSYFIDIKSKKEIIPSLKNIISESEYSSKELVFTGFSLSTMKEIKKAFPLNEVYLNVILNGTFEEELDKVIKRVNRSNLDGICLKCFPFIDSVLVTRVISENLKLYIWIINDCETAKKLIQLGVTGIITNRPELIKEVL
ncbi:MAG: hypothetical protein KAI43_10195 [Candidatus Aureabacteria bacterium]|nr:hypothetical protein [Candidatus Auribacterota bacterium]